jgi:O-antigen ligase
VASVAIQDIETSAIGSERRSGVGMLWLIAMVPVLFALSTWSHASPERTFIDFVRYLSVPVIAVELVVFIYALATGVGVIQRALSIPRWVLASLVLLAAIAIGTMYFVAIETVMGSVTTAFWFLHVAFAFSVSAFAEKRWGLDAKQIWTAVMVGLLGYLAIAFAFVVSIPDLQKFEWIVFNLGAINIRHTAPYAVIGLMVSIAIGTASPDAKRSRGPGLCALLFAAFVFWSGTRAALPAISGTIGLGIIMFPLLRTRRALTLIGVSLVGGALLSLVHTIPNRSLGFLNMVDRTQNADAEDASSGRVALWSGTLTEIAEHPLFGHGDSQVSRFVPVAKDLYNHPHNSVLQIAFQWGIVGAMLFFGIIGTLWLRMTQAARAAPAQHLHAWLTVTAIVSMSMLDGSLYFPYPVMMAAFAFAVSEAMHRKGVCIR